MRRVKRISGVLAALVLVLGMSAGCGGSGDDSGGSGGGGGTIALSVSTLDNPFFVDLRDGAQASADASDYELVVANAQDNASQQQSDIQNFVTQQVDAILVNPVDSEAIVPAIEQANNADIPVLALDREPAGGELVTTISSDNVEGGRLAGEELIEVVGSGPVAHLTGTPGTSSTRERGEGFQQAISDQSEVEVVASQSADYDRDEGLNVMQNIIQANPDLKGVFAQNDEMALGAIRALGDRAGSQVTVIGFDATDDGLQAIQDGNMHASVAQNPRRIGELGVENAVSAIDGENVESEIPVEVELVTEENLDEYLDGGSTGGS
jgi:ABC-type sugar transport system substrate-binding protein